eukprot:GEMP01141575.1.p1 GENE.GEMP01141575.1~~GEMP01141575.1.p1  ORF type:complete len:106 (-),score=4.82 GEMP01141575.1:117-434(-)
MQNAHNNRKRVMLLPLNLNSQKESQGFFVRSSCNQSRREHSCTRVGPWAHCWSHAQRKISAPETEQAGYTQDDAWCVCESLYYKKLSSTGHYAKKTKETPNVENL